MKDKKFWKGFLAGVLAFLVLLSLLVCVTGETKILNWNLLYTGSSHVLTKQILGKTAEIEHYIDRYFLDDIDADTMEDSVASGIVKGLDDKYAAYYNKEDYKSMQEKTAGNICGIGAYVSQSTTSGAIYVIQPIEGSPAQKAGIQKGDMIYAVDDQKVTGQDLSQVVAQMKGAVGTKVKITVVRQGEANYLNYELTRQIIETKTVETTMLNHKMGYLAVSAFDEVTTNQFISALDDLERKGQKGLIIDLRNNGGGLLQSAVDMLDRLLPAGVLVSTKDKNGKGETFYSSDEESFDKPVVILVNENSASASEVFAGAMQDDQKATLVGTQTFGKGIVQGVFKLSDGTALKLTTSKYYTPNGRNIHGIGLTPDVKSELTEKTTKQKKTGVTIDSQLQAGIDVMLEKIK